MSESDIHKTLSHSVSNNIDPEHISFPINIAILEDHPLVAAGVSDLLRTQPDFRVKHTESASRHLITALATNTCDAVLMDFFLPFDRWDGVELLRRIRRAHPDLTIVVYTAGGAPEKLSSVFRAGANGFLSKEQPYTLLPNLIRMAANSPEDFFYGKEEKIICGSPPILEDRLTLCELEVLRQIAGGHSVGQIAERLVRSKKTISTHKRSAMGKLGIADDLGLGLYLKDQFEQFNC